MTTTQKTQKEMFNEIIELAKENERKDIVDFCLHRIEILDNKKSSKSMTATQKENIGIKEIILQALTKIARPVTITELQKESEELSQYSNSKITALMQQLKADNKVVNIVDKKKSYYSIAD